MKRLTFCVLLAALFPSMIVSLVQAQPKFEFKLGFKALADQIPTVVGEPLENEHWNENGDSLQQTTTGLMVWRKADNWTAFTDGAMTWVNGPFGLQTRPNEMRFGWELGLTPPNDLFAAPESQPASEPVLFPPPDRSLVKAAGPDIYLMQDGKRYLLPDWGSYLSHGGTPNLSNVLVVSNDQLASIPVGGVIQSTAGPSTISSSTLVLDGNLVKAEGPDIYFIQGGRRHLLPDWSTYLEYGGSADLRNVQKLSNSQLADIPIGGVITSVAEISSQPPTVEAPCTVLPVRGLGKVWYEYKIVRDYVGCAASHTRERAVPFSAQRFEGGTMLWIPWAYWEDWNHVLVLFNDDGSYQRVPDSWDPEIPDPAPTVAPTGKIEPRGRFGKVWREAPSVRQRLGWAVEPEKIGGAWDQDPKLALNGSWQEFTNGRMYWIPYKAGTPSYAEDRWIYVLAASGPYAGKWLVFADTYKE